MKLYNFYLCEDKKKAIEENGLLREVITSDLQLLYYTEMISTDNNSIVNSKNQLIATEYSRDIIINGIPQNDLAIERLKLMEHKKKFDLFLIKS